MSEDLSIKQQINLALSQLSYLKSLQSMTLQGEPVYVYDPRLDVYKLARINYSSYLQLPHNKQVEYCQTRALYSNCIYRIAKLYEQAGNIENAVNYHLMTILKGNLNEIFIPKPEQTGPEKSPKFKRILFSAISALLGIGQPKDISLAMDEFNKCIINNQNENLAHLFLGLIKFYGLNGKPDLVQAAQHFNQASKGKIALAKLYKGICQIQDGHFHRGKKNISSATKKGLPLAQTMMGMMYEHGYGMFSQHHTKAKSFLTLAQIQNRLSRLIEADNTEGPEISSSLYSQTT